MAKDDKGFRLEVPLDASNVEEFKPEQGLKVALVDANGAVRAKNVELNAKGLGMASFELPSKPSHLRVVVGPADATDEELLKLQTISLELPARRWEGGREFRLPIEITTYYWRWWLRRCRTFMITG